jgi:predicted HTH transcriptional regulator
MFGAIDGRLVLDTQAFEAMLDGAEETDSLEFKAAIAWDRNALVKDILAMANIIDGGRIIIGIADGSFQRQGLTEEQLQTYKIDTMRDAVAPFADPRVIFRREVVTDRNGLQYIVIEVSPFEDFPVICCRDGADVTAGTIYFRSRSRRPQSARVASSTEMRDIIERSAALSMRRLARLGFVAKPENTYDYDAELRGL